MQRAHDPGLNGQARNRSDPSPWVLEAGPATHKTAGLCLSRIPRPGDPDGRSAATGTSFSFWHRCRAKSPKEGVSGLPFRACLSFPTSFATVADFLATALQTGFRVANAGVSKMRWYLVRDPGQAVCYSLCACRDSASLSPPSIMCQTISARPSESCSKLIVGFFSLSCWTMVAMPPWIMM